MVLDLGWSLNRPHALGLASPAADAAGTDCLNAARIERRHRIPSLRRGPFRMIRNGRALSPG